jgi:hypothetical protein
MNQEGHKATLVPGHPGNANAIRHGVYSSQTSPRVKEIEDALMLAPHVVPLDRVAAREIASLLVMAEAIDADIERRGLLNKKTGEVRTLVDLRIRLSGRIERWLREFGLTPASRVDWVGVLTSSEDLVSALRREMTGQGDAGPGEDLA